MRVKMCQIPLFSNWHLTLIHVCYIQCWIIERNLTFNQKPIRKNPGFKKTFETLCSPLRVALSYNLRSNFCIKICKFFFFYISLKNGIAMNIVVFTVKQVLFVKKSFISQFHAECIQWILQWLYTDFMNQRSRF